MDRRPLNYWKDFNNWWRSKLDSTGKRPSQEEVDAWYAENAESNWGEEKPTLDETRTHSKCLRSTQSIRDYFRAYRAKKQPSQDSGSDTSGSEDEEEEYIRRSRKRSKDGRRAMSSSPYQLRGCGHPSGITPSRLGPQHASASAGSYPTGSPRSPSLTEESEPYRAKQQGFSPLSRMDGHDFEDMEGNLIDYPGHPVASAWADPHYPPYGHPMTPRMRSSYPYHQAHPGYVYQHASQPWSPMYSQQAHHGHYPSHPGAHFGHRRAQSGPAAPVHPPNATYPSPVEAPLTHSYENMPEMHGAQQHYRPSLPKPAAHQPQLSYIHPQNVYGQCPPGFIPMPDATNGFSVQGPYMAGATLYSRRHTLVNNTAGHSESAAEHGHHHQMLSHDEDDVVLMHTQPRSSPGMHAATSDSMQHIHKAAVPCSVEACPRLSDSLGDFGLTTKDSSAMPDHGHVGADLLVSLENEMHMDVQDDHIMSHTTHSNAGTPSDTTHSEYRVLNEVYAMVSIPGSKAYDHSGSQMKTSSGCSAEDDNAAAAFFLSTCSDVQNAGAPASDAPRISDGVTQPSCPKAKRRSILAQFSAETAAPH